MAKKLKIKSPSLYNRISNLEDLKNKISLYGWKQLEEKMLLSIVGESGYEAIKCIAYAFYDYATENKGIFEAMLWHNKYMTEEGNQVTHNTFDILFKILMKNKEKKDMPHESILMFISFIGIAQVIIIDKGVRNRILLVASGICILMTILLVFYLYDVLVSAYRKLEEQSLMGIKLWLIL